MAKNETRRLKPSIVEEDKRAFAALKIIENYRPLNSEYSVDKIAPLLQEVEIARIAEAQAAAALHTAKDHTIIAEWAFHNAMLGVKQQIVAQFGQDSSEIQAMGLKRKSERKSPNRQKLTKS